MEDNNTVVEENYKEKDWDLITHNRKIPKLTPKGDEDRIENGAGVVEEVGDTSIEADVVEVPKDASMFLVAERTHDELAPRLADLVGRSVMVDGDDAVKKDEQPDHRRGQ